MFSYFVSLTKPSPIEEKKKGPAWNNNVKEEYLHWLNQWKENPDVLKLTDDDKPNVRHIKNVLNAIEPIYILKSIHENKGKNILLLIVQTLHSQLKEDALKIALGIEVLWHFQEDNWDTRILNDKNFALISRYPGIAKPLARCLGEIHAYLDLTDSLRDQLDAFARNHSKKIDSLLRIFEKLASVFLANKETFETVIKYPNYLDDILKKIDEESVKFLKQETFDKIIQDIIISECPLIDDWVLITKKPGN
jgi:hypothetical protein